jgi:hypothetical protein
MNKRTNESFGQFLIRVSFLAGLPYRLGSLWVVWISRCSRFLAETTRGGGGPLLKGGTRYRRWLKSCATSRKVVGSSPDEVIAFFRFRGPGFNSRRYQIFWEMLGLERGPLSLMSTIELYGRNSSDSGLGSGEYGHGDLLCWPRDILYPQKLALTSPTSGGHSIGIIRSRTKAMEFFLAL